jgi:N-acetyl-beta-hexosaminidase
MIDYLNPSRISANPPTCTTNCKKTALRGEKVRKSAEIIQGRQTMADMSNEQAALVLERVWKRYTSIVDEIDSEEVDAVSAALTALRGWVKTADRLPTEADAGYNEEVVTLYRDRDTELAGCDYWKYVAKNPECFPYWMPLPKLPEVEG